MNVTRDELREVWDIVQKVVSELPPYLEDDELTVDRLILKNRAVLRKADAQSLLDRLVAEGTLEKQERRNPKGGSHVYAYVAVK